MHSRKIKLIRALVENETVSSEELMKKLQISQRTLRAEIKEINDTLKKENVYIRSHSLGGYYIKNEEKAIIQKELEGMINQSKQVIFPETPAERLLFGFSWLFFAKEPVSIQKAAEKLYVSRTAMLQTKKRFRIRSGGIMIFIWSLGTRVCGSVEKRKSSVMCLQRLSITGLMVRS